jgi:hypothetical protein
MKSSHPQRWGGQSPRCDPRIGGDQERLYDRSGNAIATYRRNVNFTLDNNGVRFGSGNRLAGLVEDDE